MNSGHSAIHSFKHAVKLWPTVLLLLVLCALSGNTHADALLDIDGSKEKLVNPTINQSEFNPAGIDSEQFEILAYGGLYTFEQFDTRAVFGAKGSYHFKNRLFIDADYSATTVKGTFLSGTTVNNIDESATRYDIGIGFNLIEGRAFWQNGFALTNELYIKYGQGAVEINQAKNDLKTWGMGIRLLHPNDLITLQAGFNQDFIEAGNGLSDTSNLKYFAGIGIYF